MKFHRKLINSSFTLLLLLMLVWNGYLYTLPTQDTQFNYYYNVGYGLIFLFGALLSIIYGKVFGYKTNIGKMLLFFGLGLLSWVLGLGIWVYYNEVVGVEVPYPSWADYAGFTYIYLFMPIGGYYLLKIYKSLITKNLMRDSIIILILSFLVIFGLFSRPVIDGSLPFMENFFNIYYPAGDMLILALVLIALRIGGGKIHPSLYIFFIGLLIQVAGDLLYSYRTAQDIYWNGDLSDLLFTFSGYFMSIGIFEIIYNLTQTTTQTPAQVPQNTQTLQPSPPMQQPPAVTSPV